MKIEKSEKKYEKAKAETPPGEGSRFDALSEELKAKDATDSKALAAWIGRKKYGKAKMGKMAAG